MNILPNKKEIDTVCNENYPLFSKFYITYKDDKQNHCDIFQFVYYVTQNIHAIL